MHAAQQAAAGGRFATLLADGEIQKFPLSHNMRLVTRLTALWGSVLGRFEAGDCAQALAEEARAPSLPLSVRLRFVALINAPDQDPRGDAVISTPAELQAHARRPASSEARKGDVSGDVSYPRTWNAFKADLSWALKAERARKDRLQQSLKANSRR